MAPLVSRTSGSATEGVYGLILATSVIAISTEGEPADAGRVGLAVLVTALVFWFSHVYARVLGVGVSEEPTWGRAAVAHAMRHNWSLVEVVIPLVLVLGLGAIGIVADHAVLTLATVIALVELAAAGGYAALRRRVGFGGSRLGRDRPRPRARGRTPQAAPALTCCGCVERGSAAYRLAAVADQKPAHQEAPRQQTGRDGDP